MGVPMQSLGIPMGPGTIPVHPLGMPPQPTKDTNRSLNSIITDGKRRQTVEVAEQVCEHPPFLSFYASSSWNTHLTLPSPNLSAPMWPYGRVSYKHIGDDEVYQ